MSTTRTTKSRIRTKNQERLEILLKNYPKSTTGMTLVTLKLINTPKKVLVSKTVLKNNFDSEFTLDDLVLFMIKKFNLFYDPETKEADDKFYIFRFYKAQKIDHFLELSETNEFLDKIPKISQSLLDFLQNSRNLVKGIEAKHLENDYKIPMQVSIEKESLRRFCKDQNCKDPKNQVKKIFRAFAFFFQARYNLVNRTNKNRIYLIFGRNYIDKSGNDNIKNWSLLDTHQNKSSSVNNRNANQNDNYHYAVQGPDSGIGLKSVSGVNSKFSTSRSNENIDLNYQTSTSKRIVNPIQKKININSTNYFRTIKCGKDKERKRNQITVTKERETMQTLIQSELMYYSTTQIPNNISLTTNNSQSFPSLKQPSRLSSPCSSSVGSRLGLSKNSDSYKENLIYKSESELEGELVTLLISLSERKF
ncbi:hypothetical protein M0813_15121 [Anaeramoeba flamelloides]|uniref:Uncharacterized protein n=1 Tax=Anaeramoeba flamelloides TaxID=1746091 RepID=A0ABQ8Z394_9EUKA|nr:hypothetical protein M0813_15121 [Anaeramoeba flamelloides]